MLFINLRTLSNIIIVLIPNTWTSTGTSQTRWCETLIEFIVFIGTLGYPECNTDAHWADTGIHRIRILVGFFWSRWICRQRRNWSWMLKLWVLWLAKVVKDTGWVMESSECHCYFTPEKKNESLRGNIDVIKKTCEQNTIEMVPSNDMTLIWLIILNEDMLSERKTGCYTWWWICVKGAYITYPVYG